VTITNGYTDLATIKGYVGAQNTASDTLLEQAVNSASRAVDAYCHRRFWLDASPVARTFIPDSLLTVSFSSQDAYGAEIGDSTGLIVKTDAAGDGTFETTWAATDFQLLPYNAPTAYPEARPWTSLRAIGSKTFPWLVNTWLTRLDRVQVTAKWGWPAVPDAVVQATLIKAARLYHRKDSPQGVAGFGDFGPVRISRGEDPDICSLLDNGYVRGSILVA
jgi:hypothetical protein